MLIVLSKRQAPKQEPNRRAARRRPESPPAAAEVAVRSSEWRDGGGTVTGHHGLTGRGGNGP